MSDAAVAGARPAAAAGTVARRDLGGLILGSILVVDLVLLVFATGTDAFVLEPPARILTQVAVGAFLAVWAVLAIRRPELRPSTALAGPLALGCIAFVASVAFSARPRLSLEAGLIGLASALTLLALTAALRLDVVRRLAGTSVILAAAVTGIGYVIEVVVRWFDYWRVLGFFAAPPLRPGFASFTFSSPNIVATFLLLLTPLAVVLARERFGRWAAAGLLAVDLVALGLSGSRAGIVGLGLATLVGGLLLAREAWRRRGARAGSRPGSAVDTWRDRVRGLSRRQRGAALAAIAVAGMGLVVLGPSIARRLTFEGADWRLSFWASATSLFRSSPVVGTGPGTWAQLKIGATPIDDVNAVLGQAHSLYFQSLVEVGLLGVAALVLIGLAVARRARTIIDGGSPSARLQAIAVVVALAGRLGQQFADDLLYLPGVTLVVGLLIAWLDGLEAPPVPRPGGLAGRLDRRSRQVATPLAALLGLAIVVAAPTVVRIDQAMVSADRAGAAAAGGDWSTALAGYEAALALDPDLAIYRIERASAEAHLGRPSQARADYAAVVGEDLLPENLLSLAAIELELGDPGSAARHARVALDRGWRDPNVTLNAGRILEAVGTPATSAVSADARAVVLDAYAAAIAEDPPLGRSSFWDDPVRTVSREAVIRAAAERLSRLGDATGAILVDAYGGRLDRARAAVERISATPARDWMAAVVEGVAGDRAAGLAYLRSYFAAHRDFTTATWLARLSRRTDAAESARWTEVATALQADEASAGVVELDSIATTPAGRAYGRWTNYPFAVYARRGPPDLWAPQLLVIAPSAP